MTPATSADHGAFTAELCERYGTSFTDGLRASVEAAGVGDWWQALILADRFRAGHTTSPAEQRPHLAVVCTAGLVAEHEMAEEYGVGLDGMRDPTVERQSKWALARFA